MRYLLQWDLFFNLTPFLVLLPEYYYIFLHRDSEVFLARMHPHARVSSQTDRPIDARRAHARPITRQTTTPLQLATTSL